MESQLQSLFKDLKIIELAGVLAGPSVGMFFAELGAQVIKIENPHTQGDVTRSWKLSTENTSDSVSAYFSSINYRKKYLFLDLKKEEDLNQLKALISRSDVVISNHKKGRDIKFGIDYKNMSALNPGLIECHLKGFDSDDNRSAFDVVLQAETGYMSMNGTQDSGPLKMPVAMMDVLAAHQMKEAILIALIKRLKTGKGSFVDCSLEKAALSNLTNQASNYLMAKHIPEAIGSLHPNIAPYGDTYACADGKKLVLAVGSDVHFRKLCEAMGNPELGQDERFIHNQHRVVNREEMDLALAPLFLAKPRSDWMKLFNAEQIPAGAIKDMKEVFQNKTAKSMIREEEIDGIRTKRVSSIAFSFIEKD